MKNKITPFLWFDKDLPKIIKYYKSIFPDLKVVGGNKLSDTPSGNVQIATIKLAGREYQMMAAGPMFKFNESFSLVISCEDQKEVDYYWKKLTANGGAESACGWCKDKYGLSWQVVPKQLLKLMSHKDKEVRNYAQGQMMKMKKIIIKDLSK